MDPVYRIGTGPRSIAEEPPSAPSAAPHPSAVPGLPDTLRPVAEREDGRPARVPWAIPARRSRHPPDPGARADAPVRRAPSPLHGGPLALLRFARRNGLLQARYVPYALRLLRLKLRFGRRLVTDGIAFVGPGVELEIGRDAVVHLGRWSWIGAGSKIRCHEGQVRIGSKTVLGQECTISAYRHVSLGRECIVADRAMFIDFDHSMAWVETPVREQGIYKRPVRVGHNVWVGYGACVLRGSSVGDNAVLGTYAVVGRDIPADAVAGGIPARVLRMRDAPRHLRWED